ncbi:hypothetical protein N7509_007801 [Penicillium cosmopolitanum]|uniref:Cytochrome P450 n=1 Tax=Penicillium cosmopolitanum TaxID=1131564 RepID=A0A9W9VZR7_9EURO|nr:uncharacterized protein N7509_007801 [Penicillium cosmopolitanum]KAJ5392311.1 hypothetical protein N7509_007801 [Penicillium cosmopolitanum]
MQSLESKRMLHDLLQDPSRYELWFQRYASGLIFRLAYGKTIRTGEESHVQRIIDVNHNLERIASPGIFLVDSWPILRYLPEWLAPFKKEGRRLHEAEFGLFRALLKDVEAEVNAGTASPSFVSTWLENKESFPMAEDEASYVFGTLFEAGTGTTAAAMMSFVLAVVLFPQWQQAMWDELDEVVGDRMPEFEDVPRLPTCRAVIKEVLRWRPVTSGGVPHQLTDDDVYNGYFFPKGTTVHANQWAIHRDPDLYPDGDTFNPDRWLNPKYITFREPLSKYPSLQNFSSFDFGRRICPGMNIAERSLYILSARIMWACRITKAKTADGVDITPPSYDYTTGFNAQPKPFLFHLEARSEQRHLAVEEAWREAEKEDPLAWTADYRLGHSLEGEVKS